jgi:hypothetical protein
VIRTLCAILLCLGLVACGGGGGGSTTVVNPPPVPPPPPTPTANPPATTPPSPPTAVAAGATGVNIVVPGASQTPPSNAQFLGTVPPGATGSVTLFSTGDVIHQNSTPTVLIAGPGINGSSTSGTPVSTVRISGPGDITILSQGGLKDANNKPTSGVAIQLNVPANAVLGPRTVFITTGNDMTTFTGGLEVVQ